MIHEKLKALRKAKKLSQEQMAEIFHMSQNCYSKLETGKTRLDKERLIEFAKFLGVEGSVLLHSIDSKDVETIVNESGMNDKLELKFQKELVAALKDYITVLMNRIDELKSGGNKNGSSDNS